MSAGGEHLKDEGTKRQVVLAGGIAGLISRFCIAPLDVVKIRLQLQIHSLSDPFSQQITNGPVYKGTLSTMRTIVRQEGITVRGVFANTSLESNEADGDVYRVFGKEIFPPRLCMSVTVPLNSQHIAVLLRPSLNSALIDLPHLSNLSSLAQ